MRHLGSREELTAVNVQRRLSLVTNKFLTIKIHRKSPHAFMKLFLAEIPSHDDDDKFIQKSPKHFAGPFHIHESGSCKKLFVRI